MRDRRFPPSMPLAGMPPTASESVRMAAAAAGREQPGPPGEPPGDWIEVTSMGSREREWIPRHPLRHPPGRVRDCRAESGAPGEPYQFCEATDCGCTSELHCGQGLLPRRTLLARLYDRQGGPNSGELLLAKPGPSVTGACRDCRTPSELEGGRCRYCAELAAMRPAVPVIPLEPLWQHRRSAGRIAILAVAAVLVLLMALFAGVAIGLGMSGL